jgi:hypothetical protein
MLERDSVDAATVCVCIDLRHVAAVQLLVNRRGLDDAPRAPAILPSKAFTQALLAAIVKV